MRATTVGTAKRSRAILALTMLLLSPLVTAAKASARSIPALTSVSRSKTSPVSLSPLRSVPPSANTARLWSTTETLWPSFSSMWASALPTRPKPPITTCMSRLHTRTFRCRTMLVPREALRHLGPGSPAPGAGTM